MTKFGWVDTDALAAQLGFDGEEKERLQKNVSAWDEEVKPTIEAIRSCEIVTTNDLSVRINVRDSR